MNIVPFALPESGGVFDQDNKTMEAFELIRNDLQDILNKKAEKDGG